MLAAAAELGRFYRRLAMRKHRALAKVAVPDKLAVRLYLMVRQDWTYSQLCRAVAQASPSHFVVERQNRALEYSRPPRGAGELEARIMGARTEEMGGGTLRPREIKGHDLGLESQNPFLLERNGAALKPDAPAERCRQNLLDTHPRR
jgi:hypothetical protein